ncbi:MAG: hypothetical protein KGZ30_03055 [Anaplasmataceae bacterium]|nr:hypothetical protein [Anaplasmataceae bacterium]
MKKRILTIIITSSLAFLFGGVLITSGAPNIDTTDRWGWSEILQYIDFLPSPTANVEVSSSKVAGYASSSVGEISLDCATTSIGDRCAPGGNYQVSNDGGGNLSGWGWSDTVGWVSFCGNATQNSSWDGSKWVCPASPTYQVTIDTGGDFYGWAWSDVVGWISFNGLDTTSTYTGYKVSTNWASTSTSAWVESVTFDTEVTTGAQINSVMWKGSSGTSTTEVRFQLAVATSTNPPGGWNYTWSTTASTSPAVAPGVPEPVSFAAFPPRRYFRYKIWLYSDPAQTVSPRVDEVIINWSR